MATDSSGGISGVGIAAVFAGGILVWSGVKGTAVSGVFRDLIAGKDPSKLAQTTPVTAGGLFGDIAGAFNPAKLLSSSGGPVVSTGGGVSGTPAKNKILGQKMAAAAGWSGSEWVAFNNLVMGESGWDANAANPTSDARGIAQNIRGWSSSYQPGNAAQQIAWMIQYIKSTYGTPSNAWAQWQARDPHWY
jgi:hypothetical protein